MVALPRLYAIVDAGCFASAGDPAAAMIAFVRELLAGGVTLLQYRNKKGTGRELLSQAREMQRVAASFCGAQQIARGLKPARNDKKREGGGFGTAEAVPLRNNAAAINASIDAKAVSLPKTGSSLGASTDAEGGLLRDRVRLIMNDRADLCLAAGFNGVHVGQDDLSPQGARMVVGMQRWVGVSTHNPGQVREAGQQPVDYIAVGPVFTTGSKANPDPVIGVEGVRRARALTGKPLVAIGGITRANCREVIEAGADAVAVISDLLNEPRRAAEEFLNLLG